MLPPRRKRRKRPIAVYPLRRACRIRPRRFWRTEHGPLRLRQSRATQLCRGIGAGIRLVGQQLHLFVGPFHGRAPFGVWDDKRPPGPRVPGWTQQRRPRLQSRSRHGMGKRAARRPRGNLAARSASLSRRHLHFDLCKRGPRRCRRSRPAPLGRRAAHLVRGLRAHRRNGVLEHRSHCRTRTGTGADRAFLLRPRPERWLAHRTGCRRFPSAGAEPHLPDVCGSPRSAARKLIPPAGALPFRGVVRAGATPPLCFLRRLAEFAQSHRLIGARTPRPSDQGPRHQCVGPAD